MACAMRVGFNWVSVYVSANRRFCLQVKILSGLMSHILHISGKLSQTILSGSGTRISGLWEQINVVEIGSRTFCPDWRVFRTIEGRINESSLQWWFVYPDSINESSLQWWFVYPDTFVPGRYFRINKFSRLLNRPLVRTWTSVNICFVRNNDLDYRSQD